MSPSGGSALAETPHLRSRPALELMDGISLYDCVNNATVREGRV